MLPNALAFHRREHARAREEAASFPCFHSGILRVLHWGRDLAYFNIVGHRISIIVCRNSGRDSIAGSRYPKAKTCVFLKEENHV